MDNEKIYLGIDPGKQGALALLSSSGEVLDLLDMPYLEKEKTLDVLTLADFLKRLLEKGSLFCFLEKCQYTPHIKGSGAFTFGKTVGATETVLQVLGVPHQLVRPQEWKKNYSLINADKTASITLAKRLFPAVQDKLLKSKDGRAEALLIAEYCRRTVK